MTGAEPVRVLIVDDQRVVREGLEMLLGLLETIAVVGTAGDGAEALEWAARVSPDVVLMDLNMPRMDGIEATARLVEAHPDLSVVVLTTYHEDEEVFAALRAGARGFLTKDAGASEIEAAVLASARGQGALSPQVQRRLLDALRDGSPLGVPEQTSGAPPAVNPDGLTARELDVVGLIADGLSNAEIATQLFVSTATVKTHVNHVLAKTGMRDRAQLVAYAFRNGLGGGRAPRS